MDLIDETLPTLPILAEMLASIQLNKKELALACQNPELNITLKMEQEVRKTGKSLREVKRKIERGFFHSND